MSRLQRESAPDSKAPEAAMALIRFLTGPTAIPIIKAQGMEPAGGTSK